jgi:hypothetical protein
VILGSLYDERNHSMYGRDPIDDVFDTFVHLVVTNGNTIARPLIFGFECEQD